MNTSRTLGFFLLVALLSSCAPPPPADASAPDAIDDVAPVDVPSAADAGSSDAAEAG